MLKAFARRAHAPVPSLPGFDFLQLVAIAGLVVLGLGWSLLAPEGMLDWGSFVASGKAAGQGLNPYGVYELTFRDSLGVPSPNLNPPVAVYPFLWIARFDPHRTFWLWYGLSVASVVTSFVLLWRAYPRERTVTALWGFALAAFWDTLELGQVYGLLALSATVAWLRLRERDDWLAGIALGFMAALKPQFLAWPALLLLGRNWRSACTAGITFAALWAVPLVLRGPAIYQQWAEATPPFTQPLLTGGNSSLLAVAGRIGLEQLALAILALAAIALAAFVAWRRPSRLEISAMALLFALLASPITWPGYTLALLPVLFWMGWRRALPAVVLLSFPYQLDNVGSGFLGFATSSVYFFALLLLVTILLSLPLQRFLRNRAASPMSRQGPLPAE